MSLFSSCCASASLPEPPPVFPLESARVRVGLTRFQNAATLTLTAEPGARLIAPDGRVRAFGSGPWTLTRTRTGTQALDARGHLLGTGGAEESWRAQSDEADTMLAIRSSGSAPRRYRGSLEIGLAAGHLRVVNEISLETYLRGVVISEMGSAPPEALKAQAVAARTYAAGHLGHWKTEGYDVRDNTDSQAYNGVGSETPAGDEAVAATEGLILLANGRPIDALYCADCGGMTAPGATPDACPHTVSDADAHGDPAHPHPAAWTLRVPADRLAALLDRNARTHPTETVAALDVTEKDESGRVRRVRVTWKENPHHEDTKTRREHEEEEEGEGTRDKGKEDLTQSKIQNLKSKIQNLDVTEVGGNTLRNLLGLNNLRSTLFTIRRDADGSFVFTGRGWGHGRGMCQEGAKTLASAPLHYDFKAILNRYYAGATLAQVNEEEGNGR